MGPNWHMGWGPAWGWVFLVALIIGMIVLAVVLIRLLTARDDRPPQRGSVSRARELLDERYARGEIDSSEYEERRRRLDGMFGP